MSSWNPGPSNFGNQNPFGSWRGNRAGPVSPLNYESSAGNPAVVSFFNAVYGWMAAGMGLTAVVAWYLASRPDLMARVMTLPAMIVLVIAELALVVAVSSAIHRISATTATGLFLLYAAINGALFSTLFLHYTRTSIAGAFFSSALMFGAMSFYGMVTKRDLSRMGSLLFMALIGLIIATIVNIFIHSSGLYWLCTYAGVLIFAGLTAFDTQRLRGVAISTAQDAAMAARLSISGALMLYLDFINLFLFMLQIMGDRRD